MESLTLVKKVGTMKASSEDFRLPCTSSQGPSEPLAFQSGQASTFSQLKQKDEPTSVSQLGSHPCKASTLGQHGVTGTARLDVPKEKATTLKYALKQLPLEVITGENGKAGGKDHNKGQLDTIYAAVKQSNLSTNTPLSHGVNNPTAYKSKRSTSREYLRRHGLNTNHYHLHGMLNIPRKKVLRRSARIAAKVS